MKTEQSQTLVDHESDQLKKLRGRFQNILSSNKLKNLGLDLEIASETDQAAQEEADIAGA